MLHQLADVINDVKLQKFGKKSTETEKKDYKNITAKERHSPS